MKSTFNILSIASLTIMTIVMLQCTFAQPPGIEWDRIYGGNSSDEAFSVQQTMDGGYIFTGYTRSFTADSNDVYLVKTDSIGIMEWYRIYGGSDYDVACSVRQTFDGGYVIAGRTQSFGVGNSDMYLIKTDPQGDTLWTRTYGGALTDHAQCVVQTSDRGYVLAGWTRPSSDPLYHMYLVKTDSIGDTLWTAVYEGTDDRAAYSVKQTADGGYIIVGYNPFYGGVEYDIYLVKTDSLGDTLWTRTYGGNETDRASCVELTTDHGYFIGGSTHSFGVGGSDMYVIKTDSLGDTLWTRTYGGGDFDAAKFCRQTHDEGYIIVGYTRSFGVEEDDLYLAKINTLGDTIWTLIYGGLDSDVPQCIDITDGGGYIIAGCVYYWEYPADCWLLKTGPDTAVSGAPVIQWVSHPKQFTLHPAYPNPFNPVTTISFDLPIQSHVSMNIYNVLGQRVGVLMNGTMPQGIDRVQWDGSDDPSGIYFVKMTAGEFVQTRKVVLLK